jgi:hypothetical protein
MRQKDHRMPERHIKRVLSSAPKRGQQIVRSRFNNATVLRDKCEIVVGDNAECAVPDDLFVDPCVFGSHPRRAKPLFEYASR